MPLYIVIIDPINVRHSYRCRHYINMKSSSRLVLAGSKKMGKSDACLTYYMYVVYKHDDIALLA